MAKSGDLGWAGSVIWARGESLETSQECESREEMGRGGRCGKLLQSKVAGGPGRPFRGSGLSTYPFKNKLHANIQKTAISDLPNIFGPLVR